MFPCFLKQIHVPNDIFPLFLGSPKPQGNPHGLPSTDVARFDSALCELGLLVLYFAPRGFPPGTPVFFSHQKLEFHDLSWFLVFPISQSAR